MKGSTKKKIFKLILLLFICSVILQFIQPSFENPPVTGDINVPTEVKAIIKRACYDCHSNETELLWFDRISPISWKVEQDIKDGRNGLNFSEWDKFTTAQQEDKLWEAVNFAMAGVMPLKEYTLMHPSSKVSESDLDILKNYVSSLENVKTYDSLKTKEEFEQYTKWQESTGNNSVPVAANGVAYDPDYKNWQAISTTDSYSNGTMRTIFGNDVAVKAINEHNTLDWPKGTILAKVQWDQKVDENGNINTGKFNQVEYMIKDKTKYADSEGWGWARFKTLDLVPDGENASFTKKCISCHLPVKDEDYVFTFPIKY